MGKGGGTELMGFQEMLYNKALNLSVQRKKRRNHRKLQLRRLLRFLAIILHCLLF